MISFSKKEQIIIMVLIIGIIFISIFSFLNKKLLTKENGQLDNEIDVGDLLIEEDGEEEGTNNEEVIMVHISGEIYKQGLIELENGSRLIDAVNLAGGLKKDADLDRINLARKLLDEEKIYIPKIGEEETPIEVLNSVDSVNNNEGTQININKCTKEELMSLPGIGEVLAVRILEYRENNLFKTIDDIKNVSGIGEKKFEGIEELIKVN